MNRRKLLSFLALSPLAVPAALAAGAALPGTPWGANIPEYLRVWGALSINDVRRLTKRSSIEGLTEASAALKRLSAAHDSAELASRASAEIDLSMAKALEDLELRFSRTAELERIFSRMVPV